MVWDVFQFYDPNTLKQSILNGSSYNFIGFATVQPHIHPNCELSFIKVAIKGRWILQINKRGVKVLSYTNQYIKKNKNLLNRLFDILKSNLYCSNGCILFNKKTNQRLSINDGLSKFEEELQWDSNIISLTDYFTNAIIKPKKLLEDFEATLLEKNF